MALGPSPDLILILIFFKLGFLLIFVVAAFDGMTSPCRA
jgi:hypothetical protein